MIPSFICGRFCIIPILLLETLLTFFPFQNAYGISLFNTDTLNSAIHKFESALKKKEDFRASIELLERAYQDPSSSEENTLKAIRYLQKAYYQQGQLYLQDPTKLDQGYKMLKKAEALGYTKAKIARSLMYLQRKEHLDVFNHGIQLLKEVSIQDPKAARLLGIMYDPKAESYSHLGTPLNGILTSSSTEKISREGIKYYEKAAKMRDAFSQFRLGQIYLNGESEEGENLKKAIAYFQVVLLDFDSKDEHQQDLSEKAENYLVQLTPKLRSRNNDSHLEGDQIIQIHESFGSACKMNGFQQCPESDPLDQGSGSASDPCHIINDDSPRSQVSCDPKMLNLQSRQLKSCLAPPTEESRIEKDLLSLFQSKHPDGYPCFDLELYNGLLKSMTAIKHSGVVSYSPEEVLQLLVTLRQNKDKWLRETKGIKNSYGIKTKLLREVDIQDADGKNHSAQFEIGSDGQITISYKDKKLARGPVRENFTRLSMKQSPAGSSLEVKVASKLIEVTEDDFVEPEHLREDLVRELKMTKKLQSKLPRSKRQGIAPTVSYVAIGPDGSENPMMIQPLYEGNLKNVSGLKMSDILKLARQSAHALATLHSQDLIHGNFTRESVSFRRNGDDLEAEISDLGPTFDASIAKSFYEQGKEVGTIQTTYGYLAPEATPPIELRKKDESFDSYLERTKKRDVYSFGMFLNSLIHIPEETDEAVENAPKENPVARCLAMRKDKTRRDYKMAKYDFQYCYRTAAAELYQEKLTDYQNIFKDLHNVVTDPKRQIAIIEKISQELPIKKLIIDCIHPDPLKRISSEELEKRLNSLKLDILSHAP